MFDSFNSSPMNRLLVGAFFCFSVFIAYGQKDSPALSGDSSVWQLELDQVTVEASVMDPFVTGYSRKDILLDEQENFLQEALASVPSVYFKNYGNQQLSTITFRGTSASHTNVLWHGVPVNSPGLGQTDFSTWSTWLMESIQVQAGSSGALYGSGGIGGTVLIDEMPVNDTTKLSIALRQGSFGQIMGGIKANYGIGRVRLGTRLYGLTIDNDFEVTPNEALGTIRQTNAAVQSRGTRQSISYRYQKHHLLADFLYTINDREIQPSILSLRNRNTLLTENLRAAAVHSYRGDLYQSQTTWAYSHDETRYNITDITPSEQWSLLHRSNWNLFQKGKLQVGGLVRQASSHSANLSAETNQWVIEPFISLAWYLLPQWEVSATARYTLHDRRKSGLIPAIGTVYHLGNWTVKGNWSGGYRYPTLNDLYWQPGGNPDLQPEKSHQVEIGLSYQQDGLFLNLNAFQIQSTDWVIWVPGDVGIWSPQNVRSVRNRGLEGSIRWNHPMGRSRLQSNLSASYTQAIIRKDATTTTESHQLPYVPHWLVNWQNRLIAGHWMLAIDQELTSKRYTTTDNLDIYSLPAFYLLDSRVSYSNRLHGLHYQLSLSGKNLLNTYYELQQNLAMPGINYQLSIQITY